MSKQLKSFSDKLIQSLKPREKKYYKREGRGFTLAVHPSGVKTFMYLYTFKGKRKYLHLGNYPHVSILEARQKYNDAFNLVARGEDPQAERPEEEKDLTFGRFAKDFLELSKTKHSLAHHRNVKLSLNNDLLPLWKDRLIEDIKKRDAILLLESVAKRSAGQVPNVHRAAHYVFEYAMDREYIQANPMARLVKIVPALKYNPRNRVLSDSEIRFIWRAIDEGTGGEGPKRALKLILLTAQRPGEVAQMHRSQIEGNWWTIPADAVKNGREHMVYLTPAALELIGDAEGFIFPSFEDDKHIQCQAISHLVCSKTSKKEPYYGLPRWTPHDLRRTARTIMARLKIPLEHAEAVLNHSRDAVVKAYDCHDYMEEKEEALIKLETELLRVIK